MILIADSGATKTDWCSGNNRKDIRIIQTQGINPFHQSEEHIERVLREELLPHLKQDSPVASIFFYGAGCTPEKGPIVRDKLKSLFPEANIEVESDLLGAARSLCGREKGIVCILGTGSNSCEYNGEKITANVPPLGYILGDEGSGAALGKRLASDCLKNQLSERLCRLFLKETELTPSTLINKVYREPQANRFLAGLTPFLSRHRKEPEIHALLLSCFTDFFHRNIMQYKYQNTTIHFIGSIAWHFRQEVEEAAQTIGLRMGQFIQSPIDGLANYHL